MLGSESRVLASVHTCIGTRTVHRVRDCDSVYVRGELISESSVPHIAAV